MNLGTMTRIVGRMRYSTETAALLADDCYWDGNTFERHGRNTFLLRTPRGNYFTVTRTMWQDEQDSLQPVSLEEAIELYEGPLTNHAVDFEQAFPDVEVQDA
jgi:hypothetical protein